MLRMVIILRMLKFCTNWPIELMNLNLLYRFIYCQKTLVQHILFQIPLFTQPKCLSCVGEYNWGLLVRVMFANFAKIGRAAGASPIWQNFQTSRVLLIPNCTSNIA